MRSWIVLQVWQFIEDFDFVCVYKTLYTYPLLSLLSAELYKTLAQHILQSCDQWFL
jgi:hypothetical protein